jgi:hypothetical protein
MYVQVHHLWFLLYFFQQGDEIMEDVEEMPDTVIKLKICFHLYVHDIVFLKFGVAEGILIYK